LMPYSVLQKTRDMNTIVTSRKSAILPTHLRGYALGLYVADYNGRQLYWHTGGAAGMVSNVCFVPEENLGIAILTNNDNQAFFEALRYQVIDAYLHVPYVNRSKQYLELLRPDTREQLKQISDWKKRLHTVRSPLPLSAYVGTYSNELYGTLDIKQNNEQLEVRFNSHEDLTAKLDYLDNNTWLLQYDNIEYGIFAIKFETQGQKIVSVEIKANDFVEYDPYVFLKN